MKKRSYGRDFVMDNWHVLINIYTNVSEEMNILRECTNAVLVGL